MSETSERGFSKRTSSLRTRRGLGEAEAFAAPFASIHAFHSACIIPADCDLEQHLDQRYAKLGVKDSAHLSLKKTLNRAEPIEDYLRRIANCLLLHEGETAVLKADHNEPGAEILRWRWISLALPPELLLAALAPKPARRVRLLDPTLTILESTSHLHFHATAAITFGQIWNQFCNSADLNRIKTSPDGFSDFQEWRAWLIRALVARRVLNCWVNQGIDHVNKIVRKWPQIKTAMNDLRCGKLSITDARFEIVLRGFLRFPDYMLGCRNHGGKRIFTDQQPVDYSGLEIEFDFRCIKCIRTMSKSSHRDAFRKLWTQLLRIRVMLYRHLVTDPANSGLDHFDKRFKMLDEYADPNAALQNQVVAAIRLDSDIQIETLELRTSPSSQSSSSFSKLREMHRLSRYQHRKNIRKHTCQTESRHEFATVGSDLRLTWTVHFIRSRHKRLADQVRDHHVTATNLIAAFRYKPELLTSIRGLDVAGRELSGPLWCVAAPLQLVRQESVISCLNYKGIRPLRISVHVGEDFRHLLSGLRTIHEPFWWRLMRRGDRIGHAVALAWDPQQWCDSHPFVLQPRIERMFDLAWMLDFVKTRKLKNIPNAAIAHAENELRDYLQTYKFGCDLYVFVSVVRNLGKKRLWELIDGPLFTHFAYKGEYWSALGKILKLYDRQNDVISVSTREDGELLEVLRDELANLLARWGTPIELNPSSNLLIGNLSHPLQQPLFRLDQHDRDESRGLALTLSADDPVSFSTCLADEFAYAWAGMVIGEGESPAYAQQWLERTARAARRAAF